MACASVAGVLLAAGHGSRFGGNKLEAMFDSDMLGLHVARTLASVGCSYLYAIHNPLHARLASALQGEGFVLIDNDDIDAGLSHSLSLAAKAAFETDADAMLVVLADMPFVTAEHLHLVLDAGGAGVVASAVGEVRLPPALFPRPTWSKLEALTGDRGARPFLNDATVIAGDAGMLADIDTRADLDRLL